MGKTTERWMEITTVVSCQNLCSYCPQLMLIDKYRKSGSKSGQLMSLATFKTCLAKIPKDYQIHFSGYAEPFQNPECMEMIELAAAEGRVLQLYTTLRFVDHAMMDRLAEFTFKDVIIHLPDVEMKYKPDKTFYEVLARARAGGFKTTNRFQIMSPAGGSTKLLSEMYRVVPKKEIAFTQQVSRAGNLGEWVEKGGEVYCMRSPELKQNVLLPNGAVQVCCSDYGLKHPMGNLLTGEFADLKEVDPTPMCLKCESAKEKGKTK